MFNGQLELTLGAAPANPAAFRSAAFHRRPRRVSRAQWWFARMRQVVDCAVDWQPLPAARPEQMLLPQAQPPVGGTAREEQQICE